MSQGDYIRLKRKIYQTTNQEMLTLPSILNAGTYVEFKGRAIANSIKNTSLRASQIIPVGWYEEFGIARANVNYDTTMCPAFVLCENTDTRVNRILSTTPMFSAPEYLSSKYSGTSQVCAPCCYDNGANKVGQYSRDAGACANARMINVKCADAANLC